MPAITGEPWRGLAKIELTNAVAQNGYYTVSMVDVVPSTVTGHQNGTGSSAWEQNPNGTPAVLRFEWDHTAMLAANRPSIARISMHLPDGGAAVGGQWVPFGGADTVLIDNDTGVRTRVWFFDDNPVGNATLDALRSGMLEIRLELERDDAVTWGPVNTRSDGTPAVGYTNNRARGYLRGNAVISSDGVSNVALGGATPALWEAADPIFTRVILEATLYEAATLRAALLRDGAGASERSQDLSTAASTRDYSWTGTTGTNRRVGNGMFVGSELKDSRLTFTGTPATFGGDQRFAWHTSGHSTGWVRDSETQITRADRITVDPRITYEHLLQINSSTFLTPPLSGNETTGNRLTSEIGFLASNARGSRGTRVGNVISGGIGNSVLAWNETLQDSGGLVAAQTVSVVSATKGGELGWADSFKSWTDPLPGGSWTWTCTITTADLTGLEATNVATFFLVAANPAITIIIGVGPTLKDRHFTPGQEFKIMIAALDVDTKRLVAVDTKEALVARLQDTGADAGYVQYLESDGVTWTRMVSTADSFFHALTETAAGSKVYTKTFTAAQTAGWGDYDLFLISRAVIGGSPYGRSDKEIAVKVNNTHAGYAVDPVGLAVAGVLSQR